MPPELMFMASPLLWIFSPAFFDGAQFKVDRPTENFPFEFSFSAWCPWKKYIF
jgi:hypothetical protein